ncbi:Glutamate ABC transporter glutamate-binding protein [Nostocoides australiense Ben110]|uniref:Glutamate ABC transporter glutamate-binding protein n=1 Tax=Nostocoides australiense Ben110 TaxID=1193182 RepID=W6JU67_9MICO|nr:glutamate ABC transporter substrate-binding protein [Tetrasphaera australiensis]MCA0291048.1 glutamate ABC transporter substrate-binding protein [Actinomycetota bacterium]MCB1299956.1 glutamate ABC transporter substrate-binding protein [Tetrasphaera sp.]CCH72061.1 Glutamate ABC transporter glutamate-binding protein [Tetrasphaera australiensis Ben110]
MNSWNRRTVTLLAGLAVVAGAGACDSGSSPTTSTTPTASGTGTIKIGVSTDEPGVSLKEGNTYSGFDIKTAEYVAGKLGLTPQWVPIAQADRVSALQSGEVEMVVATFSITDERKQQVDFAGPYFVAHQDLLIRLNDQTITRPERLDGKILCSVTGTTSAAYVQSHYDKAKITLREVPSFSECVRNLANGDVDAVTTDDLILAGFAATPEYKGILKVLGFGFTDETYGIGIKKGNTDLVTKVNGALKEYISSGAWKQALEETVAPSGYKIPNPPTVG